MLSVNYYESFVSGKSQLKIINFRHKILPPIMQLSQ